MEIVIIEDERLAAEDLAETLREVDGSHQVVAILESVEEAIAYFDAQEPPDLIFSDIRLGDGLAFDIFASTGFSAPIIFCTAYDEYALQAFRTNGIEYITKPFTLTAVAKALEKYDRLRTSFARGRIDVESVSHLLDNTRDARPSSLLVHRQDRVIPVRISDIALAYLENGVTRLLTFDAKVYVVEKSMEEIGETVGDSFFRANRQHLVCRDAIESASQDVGRKYLLNLSVPYGRRITISKARVSTFLDWLSRH